MDKKIKVIIATHKKYDMPSDKMYLPLQVGAEGKDDLGYKRDNTKANISLSNETGNFKGGFVLEKDGIEINNTFEALVNSLRDDLSLEVARVLFS